MNHAEVVKMGQTRSAKSQAGLIVSPRPKVVRSSGTVRTTRFLAHSPINFDMNLGGMAFKAADGLSKEEASRLFQRIAPGSSLPVGKLRAELIPDSSWKRAGKTLGPQASQTTARLAHIFSVAVRVWGNERDAIDWLNGPHPELRGATPLSLIKTEAGGRAVEALLGALEYGFPV